jgi:apolipoprotein N-acyltransferase
VAATATRGEASAGTVAPAARAGSSRTELLLALASGAALGAAFLTPALGFLAWFGFVPLLEALDRLARRGASGRARFRIGWSFGFAFFLIGIHWIARLSDVAITIPWLKYPAWVVAAVYLALYPGLAAWLAGWLARRSGWSIAACFVPAALVIEELRASGEMGFPWFQPGYTQQAYVPLLQMASLGSVTLVTAWLLVLNVLLWRAWRGPRRGLAAAGAVLAFTLPWLWGQRALAAGPPATGPAVALIQGNVAGEIKWSGRHQKEILATFLGLTEQAARDSLAPAVAIWPETATGSYLRKQIDQALAVLQLATRTGVPVFSGFADYVVGRDGRVRYHNAAGLFAADGTEAPVYAKRHLVPFGERMPFQALFPGLGKLELGQAEWNPGEGTVLFASRAGTFACQICFEAIFPDIAREDVRRGARWLVNITNDEWFGNGPALHQHAAMAVFRAVENHVPLARCANTGLTLIADANGRITGRLPVFAPGVLVGRLSAPGPPTLYTRVGDWPGWLALALALALAATPALRALTGRTRRP